MGNKAQQGSSLVEVMVALFVLAIGLLGVLAMQSRSMQFNQSASTYSQAVYFANDIAERIRSNPAGAALYQNLQITEAPTGDLAQDCSATDCDQAQLQARDLFILAQNVTQGLPLGRAEIEPITFDGRNFLNITVSFDDSRVTGDDGDDGDGRNSYSLVMEI